MCRELAEAVSELWRTIGHPFDCYRPSCITCAALARNGMPSMRRVKCVLSMRIILAVPEQTEFYWTGTKPRGEARRAFGPFRMIRTLIRFRRREFGLLVAHATQYAPWHPCLILTALRDWNILSPLGLFAIFAWRFIHLFHNVPIAVVDLSDSWIPAKRSSSASCPVTIGLLFASPDIRIFLVADGAARSATADGSENSSRSVSGPFHFEKMFSCR